MPAGPAYSEDLLYKSPILVPSTRLHDITPMIAECVKLINSHPQDPFLQELNTLSAGKTSFCESSEPSIED